jgi:sensor histidine kinase YesM
MISEVDINLLILAILILALMVISVAFIAHVYRTKKRIERQSGTIKQLQETQNTAQLNLVESTLNPHLFKNILNSIQSHAYQTYFALDKLGNVLDYILYDSRQQFVSPKDEILFAQNLIEINKIKLSPLFELQVKVKTDERDLFYMQNIMAPLISIDLIENAFKHADIQSPDSFIKIVIELEQGVFSLTVANKISERPPLSKQKSGIGSKTLDQRLELIYGNHYSLDRIRENDQYIAQLKINLRGYKNEMRTAR